MKFTPQNLRRIDEARIILGIHGFISYREEENVCRRMEKWLRKNGVRWIRTPLCAGRSGK